MMLADFGADVIKIESPAGDDTRAWLPPVDEAGNSTYFASVNRNKRSVVCDLSTKAGLAHARELALSADVLIENFRPGVMAKFGLDAASLRAERPVWRSPRSCCSTSQARAPSRRSTISRSEKLV